MHELLTDLQHQSDQEGVGKGGPGSLVLHSGVNTHKAMKSRCFPELKW